MNVLMIGVDKSSVGGMWTVVQNYISDKSFCLKTNLRYIPSVINSSVAVKILFFMFKYVQIIYTMLFHKIDIVHIHMAERTSVYREGLISLTAKKIGCKVIIHMHGANIETWYNEQTPKRQKLIGKLIGSADKVIVLGENWRPFMKKVVNDTENSKVVVVYNAVSLPPINTYNKDAKHLIFLGMLIKRKGIFDLVDAFENAESNISSDIRLDLYGSTKTGDEVLKYIKEKHLENRIVYKGWLYKENQPEVFKNTLANILPSYNEGLPMTILETMSYGIPNISTNIAAIPELIVNGDNGFLIEPGDVKSLTLAIIKVCNKAVDLDKISQNAYSTVKRSFSINAHLNKILALYQSLL